MIIATGPGDLRRFGGPRQLAAYLGLVPSEHSSGGRRRPGAITKAGNSCVRHVLMQAAWLYRKRPAIGPPLWPRQQDQNPTVIAQGLQAPTPLLGGLSSPRRPATQGPGRHGRRPGDGRLTLGRPSRPR